MFADGSPIEGIVEPNDDDTIFTFRATSGLPESAAIDVSLSGNIAGLSSGISLGEDYSWSFQTLDCVGPEVVRCEPSGTVTIPNPVVVVAFDQPVRGVEAGLSVEDQASADLVASITTTDDVEYRVILNRNLSDGEAVAVRIDASEVTDTSGNGMAADHECGFVVELPVLSDWSPTGSVCPTNLSVTFDSPVFGPES